MGAGQRFKFSDEQSSSFDDLDFWQVYPKKPVEEPPEVGPPPKLIGDAILMGKTEAADGLIYWTGKEFKWYPQGD